VLFSNTTGGVNTASGLAALYSNTTGFNNLAAGAYALFSHTTGSHNTAVGYGAGAALTSGSNNIYLGNSGTATESTTMRLGGVQTRTFIAGIAGVPVTGSAVVINNQGQVGILASSSRYKSDIQPMGAHSRGLHQLRPVIFRYKDDAQGERQYGLIAEEVAQVYPELVTRGASGEIEAVRYHEVIPMLLNEVQHQQRQLATLKAENARLRAVVAQQQERDAALAARLERLEAAVARAATLASR
jgi:Chaperone of endosialidase